MNGPGAHAQGGLRLLCRPASRAGFALAGFDARVVEPAGAEDVLERILADGDTVVVLMEEELFDALDEDTQRRLGRRVLPLVLPFPGPRWRSRAGEAEAYVTEMLRQAIGYQMRLR